MSAYTTIYVTRRAATMWLMLHITSASDSEIEDLINRSLRDKLLDARLDDCGPHDQVLIDSHP